MIRSPLPWLNPVTVEHQKSRLTLREASAMFDGRGASRIKRDCDFLGIDTSAPRGGCLDESDCWSLYVFYCWRTWKQFHVQSWRGDRKDYWADVEPDDEKGRLWFVDWCRGSRQDCTARFKQALGNAQLERLPELKYAAA